ncbi:MAG: glycosyltransferase [Cyanobacteria bacterium P01_A01_bin.40]
MKKIMFYCQYLAGMGHLVRSTEIIRSLVKDFEVCLIHGGQLVPGFEFPQAVRIVHLPAVWECDNQLKPVDNFLTIEEVKIRRTQKILTTLAEFQPDCIITECFPFGKQKIKFELLPMLKQAQSDDRQITIVCSLRDLIMTQGMSSEARIQRQQKVCQLINRYYDLVLFHGDSKLLSLEDSFPPVDNLNCEVYYTGYIAPTLNDTLGLHQSEQVIVASVGGGRHGYPLLEGILAASPILKKSLPHKIHCFAGPFMAESEFAQLQQAAAETDNVIVHRFTPSLTEYLQKAELSVSLGGYNTVMNILKTKVRALLLPSLSEHQADEQSIRAEKLAELGIIGLLDRDDLEPKILAEKIISCLNQEPSQNNFDLEGAKITSLKLQELLYSKTVA